MKALKIIPYWLLAALLPACKFANQSTSPYPSFVSIGDSTYMKYGDMGTGKKAAPDSSKSAFLETRISISTMNDSVFWAPPPSSAGYPLFYFFTFRELKSGACFERNMLRAAAGDSLVYILPSDTLFRYFFHLPLPIFLHAGEMVKVHVRAFAFLDSAQYRAKQAAISQYRKDMEMQEQLNLLHYVTANGIPDSTKREGIYFIPLGNGAGTPVDSQSMVSISYRGFFLNGRLFDSISPDNPLQFRCSDKDQVVAGLEKALKMMHEGEVAKIIIPSQLAFGEKGSLTGIVPPYTTLIYIVKVVRVSK